MKMRNHSVLYIKTRKRRCASQLDGLRAKAAWIRANNSARYSDDIISNNIVASDQKSVHMVNLKKLQH